jgi:hypothetical protein
MACSDVTIFARQMKIILAASPGSRMLLCLFWTATCGPGYHRRLLLSRRLMLDRWCCCEREGVPSRFRQERCVHAAEVIRSSDSGDLRASAT